MDNAKFVLHITLFLWSMMSRTMQAASSQPLPSSAKPNCQSHCGDIQIPYPFGIGENCYIDDWFQITCLDSTKPFLTTINVEVLEISVQGTLKVANPITFSSNCNPKPFRQAPNLEGSPFVFSWKNMFVAVGCGAMALITSSDSNNGSTISAGCKSECGTKNKKKYGFDLCNTPIPWDISAFNTSFRVHDDTESTTSSCNYAFLVDHEWPQLWFASNYSNNNISAIGEMDNVPVVLDWNLYHSTVDVFGAIVEVNPAYVTSKSSFFCQTHNHSSSSSLQCVCNWGYEGNPYLLQGCRDKNECEIGNHCPADYVCKNHDGYYECHRPHSKAWVKVVFIGMGIAGLFFLLIGAWWSHNFIRNKLKEKLWNQDGGSFMELQHLSSGEDNLEI